MTRSQIEQLIDRYINGIATRDESALVDRFYSQLLEGEGDIHDWNEEQKNKVKIRLYRKIKQSIRKKGRRNRYIFSAAAAISMLLIGAILTLNPFSGTITTDSIAVVNKTKTADSQPQSILLSDGSYVLLSPGASLSYPEQFVEHSRKVELIGEAWFDIQRDTLHPFQVVTNEVTTTVLGTSFSINSLPEKARIAVKVTSGKVLVASKDKELAILEKNDLLEYESGEYHITKEVPITEQIRDQLPEPGKWKLANVTMAEAAKFVEKRWNRQIAFENPAIMECPLYASFNAHDSMEEVLMILCGVSQSNYKLVNGKITIYGQGCNQ